MKLFYVPFEVEWATEVWQKTDKVHTLWSEINIFWMQSSHSVNASKGNRWRGGDEQNSTNLDGKVWSHRRCVTNIIMPAVDEWRFWLQTLSLLKEKCNVGDVWFNTPLNWLTTLCVEHSFPISSSLHVITVYFRQDCTWPVRLGLLYCMSDICHRAIKLHS